MKNLFFIVFLLYVNFNAHAKSRIEIHTSICSLVEKGLEMNNHSVRLKAIFFTDSLEYSNLSDTRCPNAVLIPYYTKSRRHDSGLDAFDSAIDQNGGLPGAVRFSVDVSGTFVWHLEENPHGTIIIEKIWSFKQLH
jgi:hypothetical protein